MTVADLPTIAEAARLIASRQVSPVELTRSCLARIERLDGHINSFLLTRPEAALAEAAAAEAAIMRGDHRGPLHGIPIAHKDIVETAGIRTTAHSKLLRDFVPQRDATIVRRLAAAGTILLGKTATHEFAMGGPSFDLPWPPARNPWNTDHFTGGSSSGTGAAVAAGFILGGSGSDTGGSIRLPAAYCGVTGLKPTYGRVSRHGVLPLAYSLDHVGPLAWTVEDCAILLQAMAGHDPADPASATVAVPDYRAALRPDLRGLRIGVVGHFFKSDYSIDAEAESAIDAALATMRELGAELRDVQLSPLQDYGACGWLILIGESWAVHEKVMRERFLDYGRMMRNRVVLGAFLGAGDYVQALRLRRELSAQMAIAMRDVDVLVTGITPGEAPRIDEKPGYESFQRPLMMPFNVTGQPSMAVRCGLSGNGLPLSLQIAGKPFDEATVLRVGHAYEQATGWHRRRPPLAAA
jgi:Asp-tRNA(Asn)/Glu-tRNA(Gln) amidotransferase A subunit family amidase